MIYESGKVRDIKIAYIGGGSRGWAWGLMSDLAQADDISGTVALYDIDYNAAKTNEVIGNKVREADDCKSVWEYKAVETIGEALTGADFVIISILPGTFDEMASDVHVPEQFGIYQSVGDTVGPGGIIRSLRTIPMFEEIALAVKKYSPDAWVISYTNPMTVCVNTLYRVFPEIKAFGCCHEVFGTQGLLASVVEDKCGIEKPERREIKVSPIGINHFTWLTKAQYKNIDIYPLYKEFVDEHYATGYLKGKDENWMNNMFDSAQRVKFDLFRRYGLIAAAGDRHLAEFCPGDWYLTNPETVDAWKFKLTTVKFRKENLQTRLERSARLYSGEEKFTLKNTGEDGVMQIRALLGLEDFITNVNLPNRGQIPNLPYGAVVETNATFTANSVEPVFAGEIPESIYSLVARVSGEQQIITKAGLERDLDLAFSAFVSDPLVRLPVSEARKMFDIMVDNTKHYLTSYIKK